MADLGCYARLLYRRNPRQVIKFSHVKEAIIRINKERFDNLFVLDSIDGIEELNIIGAKWFNWLTCRIMTHRRKMLWRHHSDIVVTEWVLFTFCHKAIRMIDPQAKYRDDDDDYLSEVDFDFKFPTLDEWIYQLYIDSPAIAESVIRKAKNATPDCFWINQPVESVALVLKTRVESGLTTQSIVWQPLS